MVILSYTNDSIAPTSTMEAIEEVQGKKKALNEWDCIRRLWNRNIGFSVSKGKARRQYPLVKKEGRLTYAFDRKAVVVTDQSRVRNGTWGLIDFLTNHQGYVLLDERKTRLS